MEALATKSHENNGEGGLNCIFTRRYTKGVKYHILKSDDLYFKIVSDKGDHVWVLRENFEVV